MDTKSNSTYKKHSEICSHPEFMSLNKIVEDITDREVPLSDSILELLQPNPDRARKIFVNQLRIAVHEFCKHYPMTLTKSVTDSEYTFKDNFDQYVNGTIDKTELELIPEAIAVISGSALSKATTRNNFIYDYPTHTLKYGAGLVTYFTYYPIVAKNSENDKLFTEDSGIYGIEDETSLSDKLLDQISYTLLNYLMDTRASVQAQMGIQFFNFQNRIQVLSERLAKAYTYASTIYNIWSRSGI